MAINGGVAGVFAFVGVYVGEGVNDLEDACLSRNGLAPIKGVGECHLCVEACGKGGLSDREGEVWDVCASGQGRGGVDSASLGGVCGFDDEVWPGECVIKGVVGRF